VTAREPIRFNSNFLRRYIEVAPLALAMERYMECQILSQQRFERPILDIGCGDGVFASVLFADAIDTGIDLDPAEIARAASLGKYFELIACGGDAIPKPDASYRTIFSNSVLEHIPDLLPVLKEQNRLLAPGGHFFVTVPTDRWEHDVFPARLFSGLGLRRAAERYGKFYNRFWHHYHALPVSGWRALFAAAGFQIVAERRYASPNMTTLLDVITPLSAPAMASKKLLSRWIASATLRRIELPFLYKFVRLAAQFQERPDGNLIFFSLARS
jgi:SAM-dependent methyltransferase